MTHDHDDRLWDGLSKTYEMIEVENRKLSLAPEHLPNKGDRILDVGCGTGSHLFLLGKISRDVVGVDISPSMCRLAARHAKTAVADARGLPFQDGTFDYIWSRVVLSHINPWEEAFLDSLRVLKPGGTMVIIVSNFWSFMTPLRRLMVKSGLYSLGSCRHFSTRDFRNLPGILIKAAYAVPKRATSDSPLFLAGARVLYALDRFLGALVDRWGGDLCLVMKKTPPGGSVPTCGNRGASS